MIPGTDSIKIVMNVGVVMTERMLTPSGAVFHQNGGNCYKTRNKLLCLKITCKPSYKC